jgi:hypothetical protein
MTKSIQVYYVNVKKNGVGYAFLTCYRDRVQKLQRYRIAMGLLKFNMSPGSI